MLLVFILSLALPASARAHGAIPGLEGFANGLLHPVTTPAHILIILALGLLVGQRTPLDLKTPLTVFIPTLAVALLLTLTGKVAAVPQPILLAVALVLAALVAWQKPIPRLASQALSSAAALAIGWDSGIETGSRATVLKTLLGTWLMVTFLVFDVAYYASVAAARAEWLKVGLRVLGSWILAISLLMLAFALRR